MTRRPSGATRTRWPSACWRWASIPERSVLFRQSDRPEHIELMWLLASVTPGHVGRADPVVQGQEAVAARRRQPRAADLPGAPDRGHRHLQRPLRAGGQGPGGAPGARARDHPGIQHRATATSSWSRRRCSPTRPSSGARTARGKMSKSQGNTIDIFADEAVIRKQVMGMVTDTQRLRRTDPGRPEVCNVCQLHRQFSPDDYEQIWDGERTARTGCVDTKRLLADRMLASFAEARERRARAGVTTGLRGGGPPRGRGAAGTAGRRDHAHLPRRHGPGPAVALGSGRAPAGPVCVSRARSSRVVLPAGPRRRRNGPGQS